MNWREAKGEEEINIYQSERRRRTIHSLPKESRVSELTHTHYYILTVLTYSEFNYFSHNPLIHDRDFVVCFSIISLSACESSDSFLSFIYSLPLQVHLTSECVVDEGRRSQGNHGYQTRAAMEETSRQSAEAADDDESTSEVDDITGAALFCCVVKPPDTLKHRLS